MSPGDEYQSGRYVNIKFMLFFVMSTVKLWKSKLSEVKRRVEQQSLRSIPTKSPQTHSYTLPIRFFMFKHGKKER